MLQIEDVYHVIIVGIW